MAGFYVINGKAFPAIEPIVAKVDERVRSRLIPMDRHHSPGPSHLGSCPRAGRTGDAALPWARAAKLAGVSAEFLQRRR